MKILMMKLFIKTPRPSINPRSTPPTAADLPIAFQPARAASVPPVAAPAMMEFQGSSFCLTATNVQSKELKRPPHTANAPPKMGDRPLTENKAP